MHSTLAPRLFPLWLLRGLTLFAVLCPAVAQAANCGVDDCGAHGACDSSALLARCICDEGYVSVSTFLAPFSLGAYCVPFGAPADQAECADLSCGANGVCVLEETDGGGVAARCACDPGYVASDEGCVDDPADRSEEACSVVSCGEDAVCMATGDAVTCRCAGGSVVLGADLKGDFGPVCSTPPDPEAACGPDNCGPYGECVVSQAVFCSCEEGTKLEQLKASDGKLYPYCVKPGKPLPNIHDGGADTDADTDADDTDTDADDADTDADDTDEDEDDTDRPDAATPLDAATLDSGTAREARATRAQNTPEGGGGCSLAPAPRALSTPSALLILGLVALARRRRHGTLGA